MGQFYHSRIMILLREGAARLWLIISTGPFLSPVELLLSIQSIALALWFLLVGGDCSFTVLQREMTAVWSGFARQGLLASFALGVNLIRIASVAFDHLQLRRWLSALLAVMSLSVLLLYAWARIGANALPFFIVSFIANFWLFLRLDERAIRERRGSNP